MHVAGGRREQGHHGGAIVGEDLGVGPVLQVQADLGASPGHAGIGTLQIGGRIHVQPRHQRRRLQGKAQHQRPAVPVAFQKPGPAELDSRQLGSGAHPDVQGARLVIGGFGAGQAPVAGTGSPVRRLGCGHEPTLPRQGHGEEQADHTPTSAGAAMVVTELHSTRQ